MELLTHGVQTVPFDTLVAFTARRCEELLVAVLTVQVTLLLNETNIQKMLPARRGGTAETVRAPVFA